MFEFESLNGYGVRDGKARMFMDDADRKVKVHFPFKGYNTSDCTIIETENHIVMIDCGIEGCQNELIEYMKANNLTKIDYFIISHYHGDHIGNCTGIYTLLDSPDIDTSGITFILPHKDINFGLFVGHDLGADFIEGKTYRDTLEAYFDDAMIDTLSPVEGETLQLDDCTLKFLNLNPAHYVQYYNDTTNYENIDEGKTNYNNFSMVVEMVHGKHKFLFAGDIEHVAQGTMDFGEGYDVVKIEHHSLNFTSNDDYLKRLAPKYAVICDYRSATNLDTSRRETFTKCKQTGIVFTTNLSGSIVIASDRFGLYAQSEHGNANENRYHTLDGGKYLAGSEDLNNIYEAGEYISTSSTVTDNIANTPVKGSGFKLIVEDLKPGNSGVRQTYIASTKGSCHVFTRVNYGETWYPWANMTPFSEGVPFPSGGNLNECTMYTGYSSSTSGLTASLVNKPIELTGNFKMVNHFISFNILKQIIFATNNDEQVIYMRQLNKSTGDSTPWFKFTGTSVASVPVSPVE